MSNEALFSTSHWHFLKSGNVAHNDRRESPTNMEWFTHDGLVWWRVTVSEYVLREGIFGGDVQRAYETYLASLILDE